MKLWRCTMEVSAIYYGEEPPDQGMALDCLEGELCNRTAKIEQVLPSDVDGACIPWGQNKRGHTVDELVDLNVLKVKP